MSRRLDDVDSGLDLQDRAEAQYRELQELERQKDALNDEMNREAANLTAIMDNPDATMSELQAYKSRVLEVNRKLAEVGESKGRLLEEAQELNETIAQREEECKMMEEEILAMQELSAETAGEVKRRFDELGQSIERAKDFNRRTIAGLGGENAEGPVYGQKVKTMRRG